MNDKTKTSASQQEIDAQDAKRWRFVSDRWQVSFTEGKFNNFSSVVSEEWRASVNACVDRMLVGDYSDAEKARQLKPQKTTEDNSDHDEIMQKWNHFNEIAKTKAEAIILFARFAQEKGFHESLEQSEKKAKEQQAPIDLKKRCSEIVNWRKTGILTGNALRNYAENNFSQFHDALQMAEGSTVLDSLRFVAGHSLANVKKQSKDADEASTRPSAKKPLP